MRCGKIHARMFSSPYYWFAVVGVGLVGWFMLRRQSAGRRPAHERRAHSGAFGEFAVDISALAAEGKLEPFGERDAEVERLIHIVMRRTKNNPLLLGHPGVGKTAIVHGLALRIHAGSVPDVLKDKCVLALDLPGLLAGTQHRGELEKRLKGLLTNLERDPRKYILFIDEIHMLEQANGAEGALDVSDILKPALSRGELQVVGATTWDEYETYLRPDAALDRRFQPVLVDEPSRPQAVRMLNAVRGVYEEFHNVTISDAALEAAVKLSAEKIRGRYLPDKAIDLIDEAAAKVAIESVQKQHTAHLGMVHAAAKKVRKGKVTSEDIAEVVEQWVSHEQGARRAAKVGATR